MSKLKTQGMIIGDYVIDDYKPIGKGAFGTVYKCRKKTSEAYNYAAKEVTKKHDDVIAYEKLMAKNLNQIESKYILRYKQVKEKDDCTYFITKFCNSKDLERYLKVEIFPSLWDVHTIFPNLVEGLSELQRIGIMHRDIKAANVFLHRSRKTGKLRAILADFGFARPREEVMADTVLGTLVTMAPEILDNKRYDLPVDVWSIGNVLYDLCFGEYPFDGDVKANLIKGKYVLPRSYTISRDYVQLIEHCLQRKPEYRPKFVDIFALYPNIREEKKQDLFYIRKDIHLSINKRTFKELAQRFEDSGYEDTSLDFELVRKGK